MNNLARNLLVISALVISSLGGLSFYYTSQSYFADSVIFDTDKNVAIDGYDTVAYFNQKEAVLGSPKFQVSWAGADWFFSTLENRNDFAKYPERYAPQFGGYDAAGIIKGYSNPSNPIYFTVFAAQLFLHHSEEHKKYWNDDRAKNMIQATSNWDYLRVKLANTENLK